MIRGLFGPCGAAFVFAMLGAVMAGRDARDDMLKLTGLATSQEFYSSSTIPGDHFSHSLGLGGPFLGSLNGTTLSSVYCVDIPRSIGITGNYAATVATDGTIHGSSVPNAGAIAWLIVNLGPTSTTPDQLNALQAAIWRTEYGTAYQLDGADNGLSGNKATVITDYQADLTALGSHALPAGSLLWLSPFNSNGSEAQGLEAIAPVPEPSALALAGIGCVLALAFALKARPRLAPSRGIDGEPSNPG